MVDGNQHMRTVVTAVASVVGLGILVGCGSMQSEILGGSGSGLYGPKYAPAFEVPGERPRAPTWVVDGGEPDTLGEPPQRDNAPVPAAPMHYAPDPDAVTRDEVKTLAAQIVERARGQVSASTAMQQEIDAVFERHANR